MKADERHRLEENALNRGLSSLAEKARSGEYLNARNYLIVGGLLVLGGLVGYWVYATRVHSKATAGMWRELEQATGQASLEELAKSPDKTAGRIARLQLARVWLGPEGLQKMSSRDSETRRRAIESVEKAREQFEKLVDDFKDDLTLQAQCVDGAANAELALVGIPKDGSVDDFRGSVDRAADLFNRYAKVVGETTSPGESAKKKAEELIAKRAEALQVAQALNNRLTPPPIPDLKQPQLPFDSKLGPLGSPLLPKAPDGGIPPPSPPAGSTPPAATPDAKGTPPAAAPPPPAKPTKK